jgi:hypothetical protein
MRYLAIGGFGFVIFCSGAVAQVRWEERDLVATGLQEAGVYMTPTAERNLRRQIADDFGKGAQQVGFTPEQTFSFGNAIAFGAKIRSVPQADGRPGFYDVEPNLAPFPYARIPANTPLVSYLLSFTSKERLSMYLQKFSTIKISVEPAPPRDYRVVINGDDCPATEKSEYKVMPGQSTVKVTRSPKPTCEWTGPIAAGATQLVPCRL